MAYILIDEQRCKGCALCTLACPRKLVNMSSEVNSQGNTVAVFKADSGCTGCALCAEMCPDVAITVYRES